VYKRTLLEGNMGLMIWNVAINKESERSRAINLERNEL